MLRDMRLVFGQDVRRSGDGFVVEGGFGGLVKTRRAWGGGWFSDAPLEVRFDSS